MPKVLVVDDDPHIRDVLRFALAREGFAVLEAADGRAALDAFGREAPDLVVLDILMPEMDGIAVCREIRRHAATPVIFLSSKDDEVDRVVGLELGADDYVAKPFSPRELVARVKAVLRRAVAAPPAAAGSPWLRHGDLAVDRDACRVTWAGSEVALTATEYAILCTLAEAPGKVFNRDALMARAYPDRRYVSDRTIDSHVRGIRAKFAPHRVDPIATLPGFGYRFGPAAS